MNFRKLFEPCQIGSMKLKGRTVAAPITSLLASETDGVSDRLIQYYREKAAGGVALIIVETNWIDTPRGKGFANELCIDSDKYISRHSELTESVHQQGAKIALQISHAGWRAFLEALEGETPVSPSPVAPKGADWQPRELTTAEIREIERKFIQGAVRAKIAGYDAVEVHGAHGYLLHQFLSPYTNRRTDQYGGSLENRARLTVDIIKGIKQELGQGFPVLFRFTAEETRDNGYTLEEGKMIAKMIEAAGADCLDISMGVGTSEERDGISRTVGPMSFPQGWKVPYAESIKQGVKIPVIVVGTIREPEFAERILEEGKADFVALGRTLLADPEWPRKAAEGRVDDIRKCISCNYCHSQIFDSLPLRCAINPDFGRGAEFTELKPAPVPKRVMVVGGGPAGIEASLVCAQRGHMVSLYEKQPSLASGQLKLAATPPGKDKINWLRDYLVTEVRKQDRISLHLQTEVTQELIKEAKPDVLIIATGAKPLIPDIPGISGKNVVTAHELLEGNVKVKGQRVAVLGGGQVGCETALFLAEHRCKVTIIEQLSATELAHGAYTSNRDDILFRLRRAGIEIITEHFVREIKDTKVIAVGNNGDEYSLEADKIVVALGATPARELADNLEGEVSEIYIIGDAAEPRDIGAAIYDGAVVARQA
jgi:2,4-dienoyl-CoA reductase-like NADH-dependent reductase (Old Yellow Enzyme family)/pyruvate/2-oxoglutarate dehydrogenase complex dihydrolipoamide dehydrogenase (E3) component